MKIPKKNGGRFKSMNYSFLVEFGLLFDNETIDGQLFDICILEKSRQIFTNIIDRTLLTSFLQSDPRDDARCWILARALSRGQGRSCHYQLRQGRQWQGSQLCQEESPCGKPHRKIRHLLHFTLQTQSLSKRRDKSKYFTCFTLQQIYLLLLIYKTFHFAGKLQKGRKRKLQNNFTQK